MATPISDRPEVAMQLYNERETFSSLLTFPTDASAHSMLLLFRTYRYEDPGERKSPNIEDAITGMRLQNLTGIELPIPANLRDQDALRIDRFEQGFLEGMLGGAAANAANGLLNTNVAVNQIGQGIQGVGAELANMFTNAGGVQGISGMISQMASSLGDANAGALAKDIAYLMRSQLPGNIARTADAIIGSTINPKATLAFEGVELKNHSFSWTLAPRSSRESDVLNQIVRTLKRNSLPSYQTLSATNFKAYLKYPSIVDIYLLGVNSEYFMKFKPCMVRSMNVDYSSQGLVSLVKGGKPAVINLSLDLMEMDIHTANDYGVPVDRNGGEAEG